MVVLRQMEVVFIDELFNVDVELLLVDIRHDGSPSFQLVDGQLWIFIKFIFDCSDGELDLLLLDLVLKDRLFVGLELPFPIRLSLQSSVRPHVIGHR